MANGGSRSVCGDAGCNLVVLGQHNLVLIGIEWYWFNKGLLYYIEQNNGDFNQLTGRIQGNLAFRKLENRKKGRDLQFVK